MQCEHMCILLRECCTCQYCTAALHATGIGKTLCLTSTKLIQPTICWRSFYGAMKTAQLSTMPWVSTIASTSTSTIGWRHSGSHFSPQAWVNDLLPVKVQKNGAANATQTRWELARVSCVTAFATDCTGTQARNSDIY